MWLAYLLSCASIAGGAYLLYAAFALEYHPLLACLALALGVLFAGVGGGALKALRVGPELTPDQLRMREAALRAEEDEPWRG